MRRPPAQNPAHARRRANRVESEARGDDARCRRSPPQVASNGRDSSRSRAVHEVMRTLPDQSDQPIILIVDDDPQVRYLVRQILERAGYAVYEAADGVEADDLLLNLDPDLVLLDVVLSGDS